MKKLFILVGSSLLLWTLAYSATQPNQLGYVQTQKLVLTPSSYTNRFATNTVVPSSSYGVITTSGGFPCSLTLTGLPTISTTTALNVTASGTEEMPNGFMFYLTGATTCQLTLQDSGVLTNSGLSLINPTTVITSSKTVGFIYNSTTDRWTQIRGKDAN